MGQTFDHPIFTDLEDRPLFPRLWRRGVPPLPICFPSEPSLPHLTLSQALSFILCRVSCDTALRPSESESYRYLVLRNSRPPDRETTVETLATEVVVPQLTEALSSSFLRPSFSHSECFWGFAPMKNDEKFIAHSQTQSSEIHESRIPCLPGRVFFKMRCSSEVLVKVTDRLTDGISELWLRSDLKLHDLHRTLTRAHDGAFPDELELDRGYGAGLKLAFRREVKRRSCLESTYQSTEESMMIRERVPYDDMPNPPFRFRDFTSKTMDEELGAQIQDIRRQLCFIVARWQPFESWEDRTIVLLQFNRSSSSDSLLFDPKKYPVSGVSSSLTMEEFVTLVKTQHQEIRPDSMILRYRSEVVWHGGRVDQFQSVTFADIFFDDQYLKLEIDEGIRRRRKQGTGGGGGGGVVRGRWGAAVAREFVVRNEVFLPNRKRPNRTPLLAEEPWRNCGRVGVSIEGECSAKNCRVGRNNVAVRIRNCSWEDLPSNDEVQTRVVNCMDLLDSSGCRWFTCPEATCTASIVPRHICLVNVQFMFVGIRKNDGVVVRSPWKYTYNMRQPTSERFDAFPTLFFLQTHPREEERRISVAPDFSRLWLLVRTRKKDIPEQPMFEHCWCCGAYAKFVGSLGCGCFLCENCVDLMKRTRDLETVKEEEQEGEAEGRASLASSPLSCLLCGCSG